MESFLDLLAKAEKNNWCVQPFCTTCSARDFRAALTEIELLGNDLRKTHPSELLEYHSWADALRITAYDFRFTIDWDSILQSWLIEASESVIFLDHVFFYLIANVPCKATTREKWADVCIGTALSSKNPSLLETLVRTLGISAAIYPELIEVALEISAANYRLHQALVKTGYLRHKDEIAKENRAIRMRLSATRNLRAAIRRKDIKAIESMLRWKPNLDEKDYEGVSIADFARASNDNRIRKIFETYRNHLLLD
ncbi:MAG: hypothetical protein HOP23_04310 [Methylococcaceae bacterium]|nr:hypothetical protein [Methylococcaceae bacterium]